MMKKIFYTFLTIISFGLVACDVIPENERIIPAEKLPQERVVLLEDYTGQRCVNCPKANEEIKKLHTVFQDNLIVVAIHAGSFALNGFKTETGETYNDFFEITSYPKGMVNRKNSKEKINYARWETAIRDIIWKKSGVKIELKNSCSATDSLLNVSAKVEVTNQLQSKKLAIQMWLIENNIKAIQLMPDGSKNRDYIHNHVFRASLNGTWGENISFSNTHIIDYKKEYSLKNKPWKLDNCEIVTFVYDKDSYEIIEAAKQKIIIKH